jgi:hypothetical protein
MSSLFNIGLQYTTKRAEGLEEKLHTFITSAQVEVSDQLRAPAVFVSPAPLKSVLRRGWEGHIAGLDMLPGYISKRP